MKNNKKILVVDLDETLIFSSLKHQRDDEIIVDVEGTPVYTLVRPGVKKFTEKITKLFTCYIWSTGQPQYVAAIADALELSEFTIWGRDKCKKIEDVELTETYEKPLTMITDNLNQIAIIDNFKPTFQKYPLNGIWIKTWRGDLEDNELETIIPYLEWLETLQSMQRDHSRWNTEALLFKTAKMTRRIETT